MVHQYKLNGYNIVLDTASGSVHAVDEVAYDVIEMFEENTPEAIVTALLDKYAGREDVTREDLLECIPTEGGIFCQSKGHRDSYAEEEEREHEVARSTSVPGCVLEHRIGDCPGAGVVHDYHKSHGESPEDIQRQISLFHRPVVIRFTMQN